MAIARVRLTRLSPRGAGSEHAVAADTVNELVDDAAREILNDVLDDGERSRAERFARADLRVAYVLGRGFLRRLLGAELGMAPARVPIVQDDGGKPRVAGASLAFSVAHARDLYVVALAPAGPVGVDVEDTTALVEPEAVASVAFSPAEREALLEAPEQRRRDVFFRIWTRKEAYGKATGDGIVHGPTFTVSASDEARLVEDTRRPHARITLADLAAPEGFVGAVALPEGDWDVDVAEIPLWSDGSRRGERAVPRRAPGGREGGD